MRCFRLAAAAFILMAACPPDPAEADVASPPTGIVVPFDQTQVTIIWKSSDASMTGELYWLNPKIPNTEVFLLNNKSEMPIEDVVLPSLFDAGQEIGLLYRVDAGTPTEFSTLDSVDQAQFRFEVLDDSTVLAGIEDTRLPGGDNDFDDLRFRIMFSTIPSPHGALLFAVTTCMTCRRRR